MNVRVLTLLNSYCTKLTVINYVSNERATQTGLIECNRVNEHALLPPPYAIWYKMLNEQKLRSMLGTSAT
jgi:hypothetical protein